jgi:hypothetical protein
MNWAQMINENFALFVLGLLFCGFIAGISTYAAILKIAKLDVISAGTYTLKTLGQQPVKPEAKSYVPKKPTYVIELFTEMPKRGRLIKSYTAGIPINAEGEIQEVRAPVEGRKRLLVTKKIFDEIVLEYKKNKIHARFDMDTGKPIK